ncbi:adhesion-regulating molecule [Stylonychia lemnae]|uniref:Adhesion-regulating molecule n=1 Tax=Stylonychia lemnae TaxID=5949 RepID=A0A077ZPU2_STYLE|nr:adhesion-regulating molecule [Stylonychia lemnae]|eukprot:CDW71479.1 adhesion-regulating molecule [Stylonychia lemnae]
MTFDGKMVKPDRRRGIIRVVADFQGMKQFQWLDADTKNPIDVLPIQIYQNSNRAFMFFPMILSLRKQSRVRTECISLNLRPLNKGTFIGCRQAKLTMQIQQSQNQEADKEKDAENAKKVHNNLNNIAEPPAQSSGPALVNQTN